MTDISLEPLYKMKTFTVDEHEAQHILNALDTYIGAIENGFKERRKLKIKLRDEWLRELHIVEELQLRLSKEINK